MLLSGNVQITRFIIGPNVDFASFAPSPAAQVPPDPNAPSSHVRLDVHIFSAPQLDFQNSYAQLAGSVDLRIRGTVAQPAILGKINITDGTANFAGTTYRLQHGEIFFTNPVMIQPIIDIDATTRVEEYDVTIGLHGNLSQLTPTFRSEPPLPQADVISLLALGRTQEEQALYSQQEQSIGADSTTNALLGGALNAAVGSRVQKLFGGGSVKIDPTYVGTHWQLERADHGVAESFPQRSGDLRHQRKCHRTTAHPGPGGYYAERLRARRARRSGRLQPGVESSQTLSLTPSKRRSKQGGQPRDPF